ncbi:MAG: response regulator [Planctomycetota bacterium]|jgi:DNA-binding response OmpR family regulator
MLARRKILLVERDEEARAHLARILEPEYEVLATCCGTDGVRLLEKGSFDLVLLGRIGDREEDLAILATLCRDVFRPKVILLTAAWTSNILARAAEVGADAVLEAGDPGEVAASVAAHLGS